MQRIILDTSVVVSAFRSRHGASNALLRLVAQRALIILCTPALFLEYEEVLKREEQRMVSGLSLAQADRALGALAAIIEPVQVRFTWRPQLNDADDEMVLEAAVNGRADAIVTHNLRDLAPARAFGIEVVGPADYLRRWG